MTNLYSIFRLLFCAFFVMAAILLSAVAAEAQTVAPDSGVSNVIDQSVSGSTPADPSDPQQGLPLDDHSKAALSLMALLYIGFIFILGYYLHNQKMKVLEKYFGNRIPDSMLSFGPR